MDSQTADKIIAATRRVRWAAIFALTMLGAFLLFAAIGQFKGLSFIGSGISATNTISVSGEGEVFAVPDTATFSVTVQENGKDVKTAQDAATKKSNDIVAYLKQQGIDDKDVQTTDYSVNPQYDYSSQGIACPQYGYCPPGKQTISGFQVSQTLTVKVRDTTKAGDILSGVGSRGASSVSGLSFTVDDEKGLEVQARGKAIDDARAQADVLATQLGVSLVRIIGYEEGGRGGPVYYAKASAGMAMDAASIPPSPAIPVGQNKITSDVTVTYEIR